MPRTAVILNVLIASPSDVSEERDVVTDAVYTWNAVHSRQAGVMLQPVRWETHTYPASGDRPQAIVNRQIVDEGDFLIGIFGNRVGTPTGEAQSGTIEEIERFRMAAKYVGLYFSIADVPRNTDREQLKALEEYQQQRRKDTLYGTFSTPEELQQRVSQDLPRIVAEVSKSLGLTPNVEPQQPTAPDDPLRLTTQVQGEYPDGPRLWVAASRNISITRLDYLDERDAKIESEKMEAFGQDFYLDINYQALTRINQLKSKRNSYETVPMAFRLHIVDGSKHMMERVPVVLQPATKPINGPPTFFLRLLG